MARPAISVIIPTLDAEAGLSPVFRALSRPCAQNLVLETLVSDGGSSDRTREIAEAAGATFLKAPRGRGAQLATGAARARAEWLLFLHADTAPSQGWEAEARRFIETAERSGGRRAAAFRFKFDEGGWKARLVEAGVAMRCALFGLPYGDQGLLISRDFYSAVGGYRPIPLMEDVDIVRRVGRRRMTILKTPAVTSAERYRRTGFFRRVARNWRCLAMYYSGVAPERILELYEK